jgi:RNase adaptor protein for sRNA GlmZ degradation
MKSSRRFCLLLILKPELIIKEDSEYFTSDTIDDKLVLAVIDLKDGAIENNSASIMHLLASRFDDELIKQINAQLATFDDEMNLEEEINALRVSIKKRYFSKVNKHKLTETTKKSLNSLSDEEREFLKNIGKL